jgi:hypothetical protein
MILLPTPNYYINHPHITTFGSWVVYVSHTFDPTIYINSNLDLHRVFLLAMHYLKKATNAWIWPQIKSIFSAMSSLMNLIFASLQLTMHNLIRHHLTVSNFSACYKNSLLNLFLHPLHYTFPLGLLLGLLRNPTLQPIAHLILGLLSVLQILLPAFYYRQFHLIVLFHPTPPQLPLLHLT